VSSGLLLPQTKLHLKTTSVADAFEPCTVWIPTIHCASLVVLLLVLANRSTNFRIRTGIQTATTDPDVANDPLNPADVTTYINTVSRNLIKFDPTLTSPHNGGIGAHFWFRLGVLYSTSSAGFEQGDVVLLPSVR
jgi:hypothetical protein